MATRHRGMDPLILHFDVNKTVIQTDSIRRGTIDEGLREGIAELFWGSIAVRESGEISWEWTRTKPSCNVPTELPHGDVDQVVTYAEFCKMTIKDRESRKIDARSFQLAGAAREEMERLLQLTLKRMEMPPNLVGSPEAEACGLRGASLAIFPSLFRLVATLQRSGRPFSILFRSFGTDHQKIRAEWNAFCELKHPVFSHLLSGIGALDGSVPGVPDRRMESIHTMYRDAEGPVLVLDWVTNGPLECTWDAWAKQSPKATKDTRNGRIFIQSKVSVQIVEGIDDISDWMQAHLMRQATAAIKDDWAWWTWNNEVATYGKLLAVVGGDRAPKQLFFDDNVDFKDARIVDIRDAEGKPMPPELTVNRLCTKVNPVEAMLDDDYFLHKLQVCHGDHLDAGASLIDVQSKLNQVEEGRDKLQKQINQIKKQLNNVREENRRMKLQHHLHVQDEAQCKDILARWLDPKDLETFGKGSYNSVSELFDELEHGHCWLELDDRKLVRLFEMVFLKVQYKDLILIESYEQDSEGRVQSRSYLPGVRKTFTESTFSMAIERWITSGLMVNLKDVLTALALPLFEPEAHNQTTHAANAYPIPCKVQQSEAEYIIPETAMASHQAVLSKIGLPNGKHFTTTEQDLQGRNLTRFWRWDKVATWEATASSQRVTMQGAAGPVVDIVQVLNKLFGDHKRREVYENLLLQMFETFTAKFLTGGFSGSVVIRVQPLEPDGRYGEPCIVKLDVGGTIREEYKRSKDVFDALPDRCARIHGDAVYHKSREGEEFGAMRLELCGACWNVPELAQGPTNSPSTFKDLLVYESEQMMLGKDAPAGERPFGNVTSVIAETFGPGGIVSSLRKGGKGLGRSDIPLGPDWYTLKGKASKFNPMTTQKGQYPPEQTMRLQYMRYFGVEMPDLTEIVVNNILPQLKRLAKAGKIDFCPLIGLAHGDLNAANIMIDALDNLWLIDFATSVELPLFTDMCKFEMASLFEYATIPITPKVLLDYTSRNPEKWLALGVGDWLRCGDEVAQNLLHELAELPQDRLATITQERMERLVESVAARSHDLPHKQRKVVRALLARLTADEAKMDSCFAYCGRCSEALAHGDYILDALNPQCVSESTGKSSEGANSIRFFMEISISIRRFMREDVFNRLRDYSRDTGALGPADATALQLWLPVLRESFRIIGYKDIAPQQKLWSMYHCSLVAKNVLRIVGAMSSCVDSLRSLQIMSKIEHDMVALKLTKEAPGDHFAAPGAFAESDSRFLYARKDLLPSSIHHDRISRKVHSACKVFQGTSGFFAPVYQVLPRDGVGSENALPLEFKPLAPHEALEPPSPRRHHARRSPRVALVGTGLLGGDSPSRSSSAGDGGPSSRSPGEASEPRRWRVLLRTSGYAEHLPHEAPEPTGIGALEDAALGGCLGYYELPVDEDGHEGRVVLGSRLLFLSREFLLLSLDDVDNCILYGSAKERFNLAAWCGSALASEAGEAGEASAIGRVASTRSRCGSSPGGRGAAGAFAVPDEVATFALVDAIAVDADGKQQMQLSLMIGFPVACYSPGTRLCRDTASSSEFWQAESQPPEVMVLGTTDAGCYRVRNMVDPPGANPHEFEPTLANHVYLTPCLYPLGQRILCREDNDRWIDCEVVGEAVPSSAYAQLVRVLQNGVDTDDDDAMDGYSKHLTTLNSGPAFLTATAYEDEVHRMKAYYRARTSFIIDAMSGNRLDMKMCAVPTLLTTDISGASSASARGRGFSGEGGAQGNLQDMRHGWYLLKSTVDRYERSEPSCSSNAFLVLGSPGSGKTCLVHRLIMEIVETHMNLVPILLSIAEMVRRSNQDAESDLDSAAVHTWFGNHLRITFGEDSGKYKMIRQAISMHRAVFLFEGLEDGGGLQPVVERLIEDIVRDNHLVIVTSRPLLPDATTLNAIIEHTVRMELQPLTREQKRMVAHARLGIEGVGAFDEIFEQLRQSHDVSGAEGRDEEESSEDVFGNPMMLSMLLCYLQKRTQAKSEARERQEDADRVTITAVYRVAMDVMLQRLQSKSQADRFHKEAKVEQCKRVLEKIAMHMHMQQLLEFGEPEIEAALKGPAELRKTWSALQADICAGHAMCLRQTENGFRFLVKGFQDFFAASDIANDGGGTSLPPLESMLRDTWWSQTLEMLADAWPHRYVRLIEGQMANFCGSDGETLLHLAAQVSHRPVFQLFKRFPESCQRSLWKKNNARQSPLHVAAEQGNVQICAMMLDYGFPVDDEDACARMPMHMAMQSGHFQTAKFLLDRLTESQTIRDRSLGREHPAEKLAARILDGGVTEEGFKNALETTFVELNFFNANDPIQSGDKKREIGALLATFWITADQYDAFVRGQKPDVRLTRASWEKLQEWTRDSVGLSSNPEILGAMLVVAAINNVGKITAFRRTFAPDFDEPFEALVAVLRNFPAILPSYAKLEPQLQEVVLSAFKTEFNFGQFLQAESLPASLSNIKELVGPSLSGEGLRSAFGIFLFRNFSATCGIRAPASLEGALFMIETLYKNWILGLGAIQNIETEGPPEVYNRFLAARAQDQQLTFNAADGESRAIARLACLSRAFFPDQARAVKEAFQELSSEEQSALANFLNADGIKEKGFVLYDAPQFIENARNNKKLPLVEAFRILLRVYVMAMKEYKTCETRVVTIFLAGLVNYTRQCDDAEVYTFTKFSITRSPGNKALKQGNVQLSAWQLLKTPATLERLADEGDSLVTDIQLKLMRESAFEKRARQVFPEMKYFDDALGSSGGPGDGSCISARTLASLLTVYWVASDQAEAFTRGQGRDKRLSDMSWGEVLYLMEAQLLQHDFLNAALVAMMVHSLGRIPKFREQLAPSGDGCKLSPKEVLKHVMDTCPMVLPSFARLQPEYRSIVRECLTIDFDFEQFLQAELLPAHLTGVMEVVRRGLSSTAEDGAEILDGDAFDDPYADFLPLLFVCTFAELSGLSGQESLEGSLYMTEERFRQFRFAADALQLLETGDEQQAYDRLLTLHAEELGTSRFATGVVEAEEQKPSLAGAALLRASSAPAAFLLESPSREARPEAGLQQKALARLACLAGVRQPESAEEVVAAFQALAPRDRRELARHLSVDGLKQRPGFVLRGSAAFLQGAQANREIGLAPAVQILLRVYVMAAEEFGGSELSVVTIEMEKLAAFAREFFGAAAFQDVQLELERASDSLAVVQPRLWIPVSKQSVLGTLSTRGTDLAKAMLSKSLTEEEFRKGIGLTFPEVSYFGSPVARLRDQTYGALLAVFWLISGRHDAFVRGQAEDDQLSRQSWEWIQEWMTHTVKLSQDSVVAADATLVFMAIHALGKNPAFRDELLPGFPPNKHDEALARILETQPEVVPSFSRLPPKYRSLIVDSLSVDFRFNQFLQAENVPANMVHMKEKLKPHGDDGFAFFCFRIFAQLCGKFGAQADKGSLFMTESQFQRFRPGLDALRQLHAADAGVAYKAFLLLRGTKAITRFASPEHQALARLLCLASAFDCEGGRELCDAFDELSASERAGLAAWLNADGLKRRPGQVLLEAPSLLENAKANKSVGLRTALQLLLRVQARCADFARAATAEGLPPRMVVIHLQSLADWVAAAGPGTVDIPAIALSARGDASGDVRTVAVDVLPWRDGEVPPTPLRREARRGSASAAPGSTVVVQAAGATAAVLMLAAQRWRSGKLLVGAAAAAAAATAVALTAPRLSAPPVGGTSAAAGAPPLHSLRRGRRSQASLPAQQGL